MTDATDLIERLRRLYVQTGMNYVQEAADEIERLRAKRSEREQDSDRLATLVWPTQFCDEYNGVDLHEQASVYASAFGRDEPSRDDYVAAIRDAIDAHIKNGGDDE